MLAKVIISGITKCACRGAVILAALIVCACSSVSPVVTVSDAEVKGILTGEALLGERAGELSLPDDDLFALTDEMKAFAEAHVREDAQDSTRAVDLQRALLLESGLGLDYDPYLTSTAIDAFSVQQGNCLTFTALYYSLARHLGIKAYINEVDVPASWDLQGDSTYVFFRHVNAKVKIAGGERIVVDLDMDSYDAKYRQRRISEDDLRVQYFNNRAMEQLNKGESEAAFLYLSKAISIDDDKAFLWSNLGVLFKRNQLLPEAEVAFRQALLTDPQNSTAASNLARLYERMGEKQKAAEFRNLASSYRYKNPYYQYHLAQESIAAGELDEALSQLRQAIRKVKTEPRFYDLQARIYTRQGKLEKAQRSFDKAIASAKPNQRRSYQRRADRFDNRVTVQ